MSSKSSSARKFDRLIRALFFLSFSTLGLGVAILVFTFWPVALNEAKYEFQQIRPAAEIQPVDTQFGIVIPKIGANSKVIANVDPFDSQIYQRALTQGVAHAKGTVFPGQTGNSFLFSHSSVNFYEASQYNSVFYLLNKMEPGDLIYVYVNEEKLEYEVTDKGNYAPTAIDFLKNYGEGKTLTLMTCWPPGTTFKRLIITARLN
jgi:sortase A